MGKDEQLKIILRKLFDDGQNAQYRVEHGIITFAQSEDKKEKDIERAIEHLKNHALLK